MINYLNDNIEYNTLSKINIIIIIMYEIKGYIIIHVSSVSSSIILYTCTCTYIYMYVNYYQLKCVLSGDISV